MKTHMILLFCYMFLMDLKEDMNSGKPDLWPTFLDSITCFLDCINRHNNSSSIFLMTGAFDPDMLRPP